MYTALSARPVLILRRLPACTAHFADDGVVLAVAGLIRRLHGRSDPARLWFRFIRRAELRWMRHLLRQFLLLMLAANPLFQFIPLRL